MRQYIHALICTICILAILPACSNSADETPENPNEDLKIIFHLTSQDQHLSCSQAFNLPGSDNDFYIRDFRLYLHEVELLSESGEWVPFQMNRDQEWNDGKVTLLDFEEGALNCENSGTLFMNHELNGIIPTGEYQALRFKVGVPFDSNHQDVTSAEAPLDQSSMFWVWQRGYKFTRFELIQIKTEDDETETRTPWLFHLGSVGCMSEAATIAPSEACNKMNIPQFIIANFDPEEEHILLDLDLLLTGIDLEENTEETPLGCMSMPSEQVECPELFNRFGLDFMSGAPLSENMNCDASTDQDPLCSGPFRVVKNHNHEHGHVDHSDHANHEENHEGHSDHEGNHEDHANHEGNHEDHSDHDHK